MQKKTLSEIMTNDPLKALSRYRGALMGFSALLVLFFHCWIPLVPNHRYLGAMEAALKNSGWIGASCFFFLSGLGLAYSDLRHGIRPFYLRRMKRLFIPYLLIAILRAVSEKWTVTAFLSALSGLSFFTRSIYTLLWFVPAVAVLYLLYPPYDRLLHSGKAPVPVLTAAAILVWLVLSVLLKDVMRPDLWGFTNRIPLFLLGVCCGKTAQRKETRLTAGLLLFMAVLTIAGYRLLRLTQKGMFLLVPDSSSALPAGMLSVGLLFFMSQFLSLIQPGTAGRLLVSVLSFFGKVSLELYCIQEWLWARLYTFLEGRVSFTVINLVSFVVLPAAAYLLSLLERIVLHRLYPVTPRRPSSGKPRPPEENGSCPG
ncbi:MAG: acyltransferase [Clostridia bacterium]|nr:acyltransferase [Clostridia bacterium]